MSQTTAAEIDELVIENRPMARRLARRYSHGSGVDPDLGQVAELALFLAAQRYDANHGPFRPFAMATIVGELKKELRSNGWTVRVPRRLQEASITVGAAAERLEQELQRSPTPGDIAEATGMSVENVLLALRARNARFTADPPAVDPADSGNLDQLDLTIDMRDAAASLPLASRDLLGLRFEQELTQRQIAERLEISQTQVHRRLTSILEELRESLAGTGSGER